jgi:hypothetical protein
MKQALAEKCAVLKINPVQRILVVLTKIIGLRYIIQTPTTARAVIDGGTL